MASPASKCRPKRSGASPTNSVLPRAIVINKLDRERSSFDRALESVQAAFGRTAIPVQLPIGAEKRLQRRRRSGADEVLHLYPDGDGKGKECDIPADLAEAAKAAHEALVEMVAEGNDALLEEFFAERHAARRTYSSTACAKPFASAASFPVLCASALHNVGSDLILSNFIIEHFPGPAERGPWHGTLNGKEVERADQGLRARLPIRF